MPFIENKIMLWLICWMYLKVSIISFQEQRKTGMSIETSGDEDNGKDEVVGGYGGEVS